jgi:hypothetical protein
MSSCNPHKNPLRRDTGTSRVRNGFDGGHGQRAITGVRFDSGRIHIKLNGGDAHEEVTNYIYYNIFILVRGGFNVLIWPCARQ